MSLRGVPCADGVVDILWFETSVIDDFGADINRELIGTIKRESGSYVGTV